MRDAILMRRWSDESPIINVRLSTSLYPYLCLLWSSLPASSSRWRMWLDVLSKLTCDTFSNAMELRMHDTYPPSQGSFDELKSE